MEKDKRRAERRWQYQIRLERVRRDWAWHWPELATKPRYRGMVADTPKLCSCVMCGNPRRYHGAWSRQEVVAAMKQHDGMIECGLADGSHHRRHWDHSMY